MMRFNALVFPNHGLGRSFRDIPAIDVIAAGVAKRSFAACFGE